MATSDELDQSMRRLADAVSRLEYAVTSGRLDPVAHGFGGGGVGRGVDEATKPKTGKGKGKGGGFEDAVPGWQDMTDEQIVEAIKSKGKPQEPSGAAPTNGKPPSPPVPPPGKGEEKDHRPKSERDERDRPQRKQDWLSNAVSFAVESRMPDWARPVGASAAKTFSGGKFGRGVRGFTSKLRKTKLGRALGTSGTKRLVGGLAGRAASGLAGRGIGLAVGGAAGGPIGMAIGASVEALLKFRTAVINAALEQNKANLALAEFSPSMATVAADAQMQEYFRKQKVGEATAGTSGDLSQAVQEREDKLANIEILTTNISNVFSTFAIDVENALLTLPSEIAKAISPELFPDDPNAANDPGPGFGGFVESIRREEDEARKRGDKRIQRADFSGQRREEDPF